MARQTNTDARRRKGNPASKRMVNVNLKARRARCWARGQVRKAARQAAQNAAHARNVTNGTSPWLQAKEKRAEARRA